MNGWCRRWVRRALEGWARRLEYATVAWNLGEAVLMISLGVAAGSPAVVLPGAALSDLGSGRRAGESLWGIAQTAVTAVVMFGLAIAERRIAHRLGSAPNAAFGGEHDVPRWGAGGGDAHRAALNAAFGWCWADPSAALAIAAVAASEARDDWQEAAEFS